MKDSPDFYEIGSLTMNPCFMEEPYKTEATKTWRCPGCSSPKPGVQAVDVWLQNRVPSDKPFNLVYGYGVGVVHRELLALVGDDVVQRDLYLGKVYGTKDKLVPDWVTFRGRHRVYVRGGTGSRFRTCDRCRRPLYTCTGKEYLYPAPPADATIFESTHWGLILPPGIYQRIAEKKWRRMTVTELSVLPEPLDGFGDLPLTHDNAAEC